jgi:hypothetical protein
MRFVTILLKDRLEALIVWTIDELQPSTLRHLKTGEYRNSIKMVISDIQTADHVGSVRTD